MHNHESEQKSGLVLLGGFSLGASAGVLYAFISGMNSYFSHSGRLAQQLFTDNPAEWDEAQLWLGANRDFWFIFGAPAYGFAAGILGIIVFLLLHKTRLRVCLPVLVTVGAILFAVSLLASVHLYNTRGV